MQTIKRHPVILILASVLAILSFPMKWSSFVDSRVDDRRIELFYLGYDMFHANMAYLPTLFYIILVVIGFIDLIMEKKYTLLYQILFLLHLLPMGGFIFVLTVDYYWDGYWEAVYLGWYLYLVASSIICIWLWQRGFVKPLKITDASLLDDL